MVAAFWREQSGIRHITPQGKSNPEGPWLLSALAPLWGLKVCEFGCGPGRIASLFDRVGYVGVDICEAAVIEARKRNPGYRFEVTDETAKIGPVDVIVCHTVLMHVPDEELAGVLARFDADRVMVNEMLGRAWRRDGTPPVFNREWDDYVTAFAAAGFSPVSCETETYEHYGNPFALMTFQRTT